MSRSAELNPCVKHRVEHYATNRSTSLPKNGTVGPVLKTVSREGNLFLIHQAPKYAESHLE